MSDARWIEVEDDVNAAIRHYQMAVALHEKGGFDDTSIEGYQANMAFMHAMQSAHTSFENAMIRILKILEEEKPTGESWHRDLIKRVARPLPTRPAILTQEIAHAADESRAFRNIATRSYDSFAVEKSDGAVAAAHILASGLAETVRGFISEVDPPEEDGGGDGSGGGMAGGPW